MIANHPARTGGFRFCKQPMQTRDLAQQAPQASAEIGRTDVGLARVPYRQ
jgi:hypothetical protein